MITIVRITAWTAANKKPVNGKWFCIHKINPVKTHATEFLGLLRRFEREVTTKQFKQLVRKANCQQL